MIAGHLPTAGRIGCTRPADLTGQRKPIIKIPRAAEHDARRCRLASAPAHVLRGSAHPLRATTNAILIGLPGVHPRPCWLGSAKAPEWTALGAIISTIFPGPTESVPHPDNATRDSAGRKRMASVGLALIADNPILMRPRETGFSRSRFLACDRRQAFHHARRCHRPAPAPPTSHQQSDWAPPGMTGDWRNSKGGEAANRARWGRQGTFE